MKNIYTAVALMICAVCAWGQVKIVDCSHGIPQCPADGPACQCGVDSVQWVISENGGLFERIGPALKCGKYQHLSYVVKCSSSAACDPTPQCADDMHEVTEAEWQAMLAQQERLQNALDHLLKAMEHQAKINDLLTKH